MLVLFVRAIPNSIPGIRQDMKNSSYLSKSVCSVQVNHLSLRMSRVQFWNCQAQSPYVEQCLIFSCGGIGCLNLISCSLRQAHANIVSDLSACMAQHFGIHPSLAHYARMEEEAPLSLRSRLLVKRWLLIG